MIALFVLLLSSILYRLIQNREKFDNSDFSYLADDFGTPLYGLTNEYIWLQRVQRLSGKSDPSNYQLSIQSFTSLRLIPLIYLYIYIFYIYSCDQRC